MPDFVFQGPSPGAYPMGRDAYGYPVGTVKPGDVLELTEALDADWMPYEGDERGGIEVKPDPADVGVSTPEAAPEAPQEPGSEQGNDDTAEVSASEEN